MQQSLATGLSEVGRGATLPRLTPRRTALTAGEDAKYRARGGEGGAL